MSTMAFRHPYLFFLGVGLMCGFLCGAALSLISPLALPLNLVIGMNIGAFLLCGYDKSVAVSGGDESSSEKVRTRVPELVLYLIALAGGSAGLLFAMKLFRHKTAAPKFQFWLVIVILVQALFIRWMVKSFDLDVFGDASRPLFQESFKEKFLNGEPLF